MAVIACVTEELDANQCHLHDRRLDVEHASIAQATETSEDEDEAHRRLIAGKRNDPPASRRQGRSQETARRSTRPRRRPATGRFDLGYWLSIAPAPKATAALAS